MICSHCFGLLPLGKKTGVGESAELGKDSTAASAAAARGCDKAATAPCPLTSWPASPKPDLAAASTLLMDSVKVILPCQECAARLLKGGSLADLPPPPVSWASRQAPQSDLLSKSLFSFVIGMLLCLWILTFVSSCVGPFKQHNLLRRLF